MISTKFLCRPYVVYRWLKARNSSKFQNNPINILVWSSYPGIGDAFSSLDALYNLSKIVKEIPNAVLYIKCSDTLIKVLGAIGEDFGCKDYVRKNGSTYGSRLEKLKAETEFFSREFWDYIIFLDPPSQYQKSLVVTMRYGHVLFPCSKTTPSKATEGLFYERLMHDVTRVYAKNGVDQYENYLTTTKRVVETFRKIACSSGKKFGIYDSYSVVCPCDSYGDIKDYCVIAVGYDKNNPHEHKGWPLDRYAEICKWILKSSKLNVVLTGTLDDAKQCGEIKELADKNNPRIVDLMGKLSFGQWLNVLKNADFVLGNDSGTVHVAAKLNTKTFVICGYWDYGKYFPYPNEFVGCLPELLIAAKPNCAFCYAKYFDQEKNSKECEDCVKKYGVYKCIMDVSLSYVKGKVQKVIDKTE